ncbi:hypothetical protein [Flammeovirga aprica]|uniref:Outer membrane protein beta-barrel domain-containing protein n=1 Tax=Flammeovirga aprica JL-4 TaxID=694437 RepID=A0A7X9S1S6_9BACT|nr:hypothetical protein [Flammeovirga aprica]NME72811.1 hypothetical protein [Flammeovirga aprica JL-4]
MKNLYTILILLLVSFTAKAQSWFPMDEKLNSIYVGYSGMTSPYESRQGKSNMPIGGEYSTGGFEIGMTVHNVLIDFQANMKMGSGESNSVETGNWAYTGDQSLLSWHVGYALPIYSESEWLVSLAPKIGAIHANHIINDYGGYTTWRTKNAGSSFDYGIDLFTTYKKIVLKIGYTKYNEVSASIGIRL